jgi:hypothetical protein
MMTTPAAALAAALTSLLLAVSVPINAKAATLTLSKFRHCPVDDPVMIEHEGGLCLYARSSTTSVLNLDGIVVPLTSRVVLQGGSWISSERSISGFVAAEGAPSLKPADERVPGGLSTIVDATLLTGSALARYERLLRSGETTIKATVELARPPSTIGFGFVDLLSGRGVALSLPLKLHLHGPNGFLGKHCYLGSQAAPIQLQLTDGTTSPPPPFSSISGKIGTPTESKAEVVTISENTLVENAFALPTVEGCGAEAAGVAQIDASLNSRLGLPSAPGTSSALLEGTLAAAAGTNVAEHRKREQL